MAAATEAATSRIGLRLRVQGRHAEAADGSCRVDHVGELIAAVDAVEKEMTE